MKCILPECPETIPSPRNNLKQSYDISSELYEHLQTKHSLNLDTNTVSVEFKCKHCGKILHAKSTRPQENPKLLNYQTTKNWSKKLTKHIIMNHDVVKQSLDIKNVWQTHYEKGPVSIQERGGKQKKPKIVKEKQTYSCNECGKLFNQKANYMAHMVYHSDERLFPCDVCVKSFKTLRDLDVHKRTHNGETPFSCNTCGTAFSQSANLWSHEKRYHYNGIYPCKDCKNIFTTGWNLKTHRTSACTLKPFPCDQCSKGYGLKGNLENHKKTHKA